jgi:leishmanolysin-like peptidase
MTSALARFSALLRVTPVSGNLFAYRPCTSQWEDNGNCASVDTAPTCGTISLSTFLGVQTYYPSFYTPSTLSATGAGVPNADTVVFVTAQQTSRCGSGTIAYASHCQRASNDRPTFGNINFCPGMLPATVDEDFLSTALHELAHVLAFSSSLFPYFRDDAGAARTPRDSYGDPADAYYKTFSCGGSSTGDYVASPSTISYANERGMSCSWGSAATWATANIPYGSGGKAPSDCVARISTPRVAAAAKIFFGCSTLAGADLENQDTSSCFVQGSHWDARTLASEFMAAYSSVGSKISPITLAVFEDSGWYSPVYSSGDAWFAGKDWGYKQGCAFATEKCSASNAGSPPHFAFGTALSEVSKCTVDRRFKGYASITTHSPLPAQYQYFPTSSWGGSSELYDYCPAIEAHSNGDCTSASTTANSNDRGGLTGSSSLCHMTTLRASGYSATSTQSAGCYRVACAANRASYTVTLASGATATCSTDGAAATFSGFSGSLICGSPASVCGTGYVWDGSATPSITPSLSLTPSTTSSLSLTATGSPTTTLTATGTPTPSLSVSSTGTASNTPLVTLSPGSAVLRLSLVFSGSSGTFTATMQGIVISSTAAALGVPRASVGWLGVTNPSAPGISRLLQAGARVQLSLMPAAAASSPLIQASMASGSSLSTAVTSALSTGFNTALAAQPDAAALATALGYGTTAAMVASLSLDANIPISAVVMSASPSASPVYGSTLSPAATGGLVGGILGGAALALYLITVAIVDCCIKCTCCCQHAQCKKRYQTRSIWCCCCCCCNATQAAPPAPVNEQSLRGKQGKPLKGSRTQGRAPSPRTVENPLAQKKRRG